MFVKLLIYSSLLALCFCQSTLLYVSTSGNDNNNCTAMSYACLSLSGALQKTSTSTNNMVVITFEQGTYSGVDNINVTLPENYDISIIGQNTYYYDIKNSQDSVTFSCDPQFTNGIIGSQNTSLSLQSITIQGCDIGMMITENNLDFQVSNVIFQNNVQAINGTSKTSNLILDSTHLITSSDSTTSSISFKGLNVQLSNSESKSGIQIISNGSITIDRTSFNDTGAIQLDSTIQTQITNSEFNNFGNGFVYGEMNSVIFFFSKGNTNIQSSNFYCPTNSGALLGNISDEVVINDSNLNGCFFSAYGTNVTLSNSIFQNSNIPLFPNGDNVYINNCNFTDIGSYNSTANYLDGGILLQSSSNSSLFNITIENSMLTNTSIITRSKTNNGMLKNCRFADSAGFVKLSGTWTLDSNTFENLSPDCCTVGKIYIHDQADSGVSLIENCNFQSSSVSNGMLALSGSKFKISNCNFHDISSVDGGGVYVNTNMVSSLEVINSQFKNINNEGGGALYFNVVDNNSHNLSISGCTFTSNTAGDSGGAIFTSGATVDVSNCTFESNSAVRYGGAIYTTSHVNMTVENSIFLSNSASEGGAIAISQTAEANLYPAYSAEIEIIDCTFNDNEADTGAVFACDVPDTDFTLSIDDASTMENNDTKNGPDVNCSTSSHMWLWITLGVLGGILCIIVIVIIVVTVIKKRKKSTYDTLD